MTGKRVASLGRPLSLSALSAALDLALRAFVAALVGLALTCAGATVASSMPWSALALPLGAALAGAWRFGRAVAAGAALGVVAALLGMSAPLGLALLAGCGLMASVLAAVAVLRHLHFDGRLERPLDLANLVLVAVVVAAFPVAGLLTAWAVVPTAPGPLLTWLAGWVVIALGTTATAVGVLAVDRSLPELRRLLVKRRAPAPAFSRPPSLRSAGAAASEAFMRWRSAALGGAAIVGVLLALWSAPSARPPWASLTWVLPIVLALVLSLRGQLALSMASLVTSTLVLGAQAGAGSTMWSTGASPGTGLAAWSALALSVSLLAHAAMVAWRSRSQRWEWALDGTGMGVADWHLLRDDQFTSTAWRTLTPQYQEPWSPALWQSQVHPEDRPALTEAIRSLSAGEAGRQRLELRLPQVAAGAAASADGWRWSEATLMVIERDGAGQPVRLLATLADVQERRSAQERQLMSVSLFQHLHEGLLITDADLHALDANPAYTQILGVPRDRLIGTVPSLLQPAPDDPLAREQRAAMWAGLANHGTWRGELLERRRNGELCTLQATISLVRGPADDLRFHVLVISDISEQREQRAQLERQALYDELTRLPNRARLSQLLDDAMRATDRDGYLLVVCYLDLDRFKPVNDTFGHAAGDRLLAELSGRLRSALRSREHWTDSAARLGGDEFALLLRAGTLEEARLAVERVLRVVAQPYLVDPKQEPVQITASMGATIYPVDRSDADTLLRHADHAMYGAKQRGRNGYLFFDPEHRRRAEQRVLAIGRIQEALDQQEFLLFYQPKVDMRTGVVLGFEALLRWEHPQQGLVAPLRFLPLIEHTGLSSRIGDWVLAQALEHLAQWRRDGLDFAVSVNITARHLQEPDFAQRLVELLARHPEPLAEHLELEITESAAHADVPATSALMHRCRSGGVRFALDDFGTGYSTLTYLKQLPVDVLKIDRSFVHHMLDDSQDRAIVEGVIGLARTFGCAVVAEGVESPAQARALLEMGCDIGQGTGIAAAMPSSLVANWTRDYRGVFALIPAPPGSAADPGVARLGR